jgi:hypothetical protein
MAKVIEFYIPKNFRNPFMRVAQLKVGKIIDFCATTSGTGSDGRQGLLERENYSNR